MIVRILSNGKSFAGLATYLTHDPDATTSKRVGWTHTMNLAHDHVPSAVDEMLWTARSAELLKQEAGIRAGGRATENMVKHVSLNWSPEETPTREHMVETTEAFLRHMNWHEHQALIVAHEDRAHTHTHIMLNAIHPENGLRLDDNFERRRAQAWARGYEEENGRVFCEQRFKNADEREDAPTRPAWIAFKNRQTEFEHDERIYRGQAAILSDPPVNPGDSNDALWKKLKEIQRDEREAFFADGKLEFSDLRRSIYREVREEFRERWAEFYAAQKNGADPAAIAGLKKDLLAEQAELLETRRDQACAELRDSRDQRYRELLGEQRDTRHEMRVRQDKGLDNAGFVRALVEKESAEHRPVPSFRDAAAETATRPAEERGHQRARNVEPRERDTAFKSAPDVGASIATGLGFGLLSILGGVADGLTGSAPAPRSKQADGESSTNLFDAAFEEARKQQLEEEEANSDRRRRQRSYGD